MVFSAIIFSFINILIALALPIYNVKTINKTWKYSWKTKSSSSGHYIYELFDISASDILSKGNTIIILGICLFIVITALVIILNYVKNKPRIIAKLVRYLTYLLVLLPVVLIIICRIKAGLGSSSSRQIEGVTVASYSESISLSFLGLVSILCGIISFISVYRIKDSIRPEAIKIKKVFAQNGCSSVIEEEYPIMEPETVETEICKSKDIKKEKPKKIDEWDIKF